MLTNALPRLLNLRNVHISAGIDSILPVLRVLQACTPRLKGLSLQYAYWLLWLFPNKPFS